jgi:hypothetical protein
MIKIFILLILILFLLVILIILIMAIYSEAKEEHCNKCDYKQEYEWMLLEREYFEEKRKTSGRPIMRIK